jgi:transposase InsO family protein
MDILDSWVFLLEGRFHDENHSGLGPASARAGRQTPARRDPPCREVSGNVAATCRYYGISRQAYYGWLKRYEKQRPGHALQADVKFIEPLGQTGKKKRYYQYTAIDDCTRLRVLRAYPTHDQKTAIRFIDHVLGLNGKVERSHRIDSEEFHRLLEGQVIDDISLFNDKLQEWEDYYNYDRPHGALAGSTPYERLKQKTQDPLS